MRFTASGLRDVLSRHALGLWFCGIAGLGALRCWMKIVREGQAPWPPELWPWIAGTALCALVGLALLWRERRSHALLVAGQSAVGEAAS